MMEDNTLLDRATRLKRLRMRAWRRGMKEMDLILGGFVDARGLSLTDGEFDALEEVMNRQDQQVFLWVTGAQSDPDDSSDAERAIVASIAKFCNVTP